MKGFVGKKREFSVLEMVWIKYKMYLRMMEEFSMYRVVRGRGKIIDGVKK